MTSEAEAQAAITALNSAQLEPGIVLPEARRALEGVAAHLAKEYPDTKTGNSVTVMALRNVWPAAPAPSP